MDAKMFERIKRHLRLFSNPVLLVNRDAECIYCNRKNFCRTGTSLLKLFHQPFVIHDDRVDEVLLILKVSHIVLEFLRLLRICLSVSFLIPMP